MVEVFEILQNEPVYIINVGSGIGHKEEYKESGAMKSGEREREICQQIPAHLTMWSASTVATNSDTMLLVLSFFFPNPSNVIGYFNGI